LRLDSLIPAIIWRLSPNSSQVAHPGGPGRFDPVPIAREEGAQSFATFMEFHDDELRLQQLEQNAFAPRPARHFRGIRIAL
jgi:hypothetical protein